MRSSRERVVSAREQVVHGLSQLTRGTSLLTQRTSLLTQRTSLLTRAGEFQAARPDFFANSLSFLAVMAALTLEMQSFFDWIFYCAKTTCFSSTDWLCVTNKSASVWAIISIQKNKSFAKLRARYRKRLNRTR